MMSALIDRMGEWLNISYTMIWQYLLFTGIFYLIFYVWKNKTLWAAKIQQRYPKNKHVFREIAYSISTLFILGAIICFVVWANKKHLTLMYSPIDKYGYPYYFFSIILMLVVHDAYFYWTHRLLHWKPLFKRVHKIHHLSTNPTPFAAYAFHPIEAVVEMGIMPVIVFTIPHHISTISIFAIYSLLLNVGGHSGFEFFPKWVIRHKIFKWHNTATHHNLHHRFFKTNFGLYFNFWDKVMKTNHPEYETHFEQVVDQRTKGNLEGDLPSTMASISKSEKLTR